MYQSLILILLHSVHAAAPPVANGCWRGTVNIKIAPAEKALPTPVPITLVFSGREDFAHAVLIKNGAREYVTDFDCDDARPAKCTFMDDGGAFLFGRIKDGAARLSLGAAVDIDDRESVRHARITSEGYQNVRSLAAIKPADCAREQARVRTLFIHGAEVE